MHTNRPGTVTTGRVVTQTRYGGPEVLRLTEVPLSVPGAGQVLVRVHAPSMNARDWHVMRGEPLMARLMERIPSVLPNHRTLRSAVLAATRRRRRARGDAPSRATALPMAPPEPHATSVAAVISVITGAFLCLAGSVTTTVPPLSSLLVRRRCSSPRSLSYSPTKNDAGAVPTTPRSSTSCPSGLPR